METSSLENYLESIGIQNTAEIIHNPSYDFLFEEELNPSLEGFEKGQPTELGAINVLTGEFTGRSPKDKYIVKDATTENTVWWTSPEFANDNKPIPQSTWDEIKQLSTSSLANKRLFVVDAFCGANKNTRLKVRFVMEVAWQAHFVINMFIRPTKEELENFGEPDFTVINASKASNHNYKTLGLNSENFIMFNLTEKMQLIGGTWYGGEMKKGMFAMMNYYLPQKNILSMHCASNMNESGETALFFGLSGTGKTTLSTDPKRKLIGDDEHGWDNEGIFNFEGGCYAKTMDLSEENEPDIYHAIKKNALLENVIVQNEGKIDFSNISLTRNTRVSYPIFHIENRVIPVSKGNHANKIIFLTADRFGVMPPVSILTEEQAQYHFLSGFTAKVAGTERGVTDAAPTFSACFGEAFLSLHPTRYAELLKEKIKTHNCKVYLVNTGWNGTGKRISIKNTRNIIHQILNGNIDNSETGTIPYFNLKYPTSLENVETNILDPRNTYQNPSEWEKKATHLAKLFVENFHKYTSSSLGKTLHNLIEI